MLSSSFQLAAVSPLASHSPPKYNFFSSIKACSTVGKRTGEGPIPESRLAATSVVAEKAAAGLPRELRPESMPKHVSIILDGNGRWAMQRGLTVQAGHQAGTTNLKHVLSYASNFGIKVLSVYAFSTENWSRPKLEVDFLMKAFEGFLQTVVLDLIRRQDMRFSAFGNLSRLPKYLQDAISLAEEMSQFNKGMHFIAFVSYSGRDEIVEAAKKIATKVERGIIRANEVDENMVQQHLMTNIVEFPNPDLLIRTSGELRISNFLLWQLAYTEFYFVDHFFPDFGEDDLVEALASYQRRKRRYGQRRN